MIVSISIVHSMSASGIYFVGDTPAKIGVPTLRSSWSSDILSVLFSFVNAAISSPQVVLSRSNFKLSERHSAFAVFSYCVYYTLCEKYGSDTYVIQRAIAGCFAYITKTVSHWILPRWHFHEFSLLVFIQWYFTVLTTGFHSASFFGIDSSILDWSPAL